MKILYIILILQISRQQTELLDELSQIESQSKLNLRPIIGILTQPVPWKNIQNKDQYTYIASSYVKNLQASGARVVHLNFHSDIKVLKEIMGQINGLFLTGGAANLLEPEQTPEAKNEIKTKNGTANATGSVLGNATVMQQELGQQQINPKINYIKTKYQLVVEELLEYAIELNKKGSHFPVWGTCLGYEQLMLAFANSTKILSNFNSTNHSMKLFFFDTNIQSRLFASASDRMKFYFQKNKIMYFNHMFGVSKESFIQNVNLSKFFTPLTFNYDKNNKEFISAVESKEFPIWGVQFHPEKNPFELKDHIEAMHSPGSIQSTRYFSEFFINECRQNLNKFWNAKQEKQLLVDNYYPVMYSENFSSVYIFVNTTNVGKELFRANIRIKKNNSRLKPLDAKQIQQELLQDLELERFLHFD